MFENEIDYLSVYSDAVLYFQFIAKCVRKAVSSHKNGNTFS